MATTPLRVLFVHDDTADMAGLADELRRGGYELESSSVATKSALQDALARDEWDVVIADHQIAHLDVLSALALVQDTGRDIPFIIVGGKVGEQKAVRMMKAGVVDFVPGDAPARLVRALSRAIREAEDRRGRRRAERALMHREEQLRLALAAARMGTWDLALETGRFTWSDQAAALLGVSDGDPPRDVDAYLDLVLSEDRAEVDAALTAAIDGDRDYAIAHRIRAGDGPIRWIGIKGRLQRGDGSARMSGTVADITDRKVAEAALSASEQRYRELYEEAPVALFSVNPDGDIVRANRRATEVFGYRAAGLMGRRVTSLAADTAAGKRRLAALDREVRAGRVVADDEIEWMRPDGTRWWGSLSVKPVLDEAGRLTVSRATLVDVTVRRRAEELLQLSQRAIEGSPDLIMICDRDYVLRRVNEAHTLAYGRSQEELVGVPLWEVMGREPFDAIVKPRFDRCLDGEDVAFETWLTFPTVGRRFMSVAYSPLRSSHGTVEGVIAIARDATERKLADQMRQDLEAQLLHAQKMDSLGTLAGGIAHDFNNLLLAILGYGELTRDVLPPDSPLRGNVEQILAAGERAQELVKQILAFGRRSERSTRPVEVQEVVREAASFLRATLPSTIEIVETMSPEPCVVSADGAQLHQVVLNLASNALHAMRDGGELGLAVGHEHLGRADAARLGVTAGPYVRLSVSDTGSGMTPEVIDRIFDPFFTTKGPGEGTGLGLSVVHGIVMSHAGALQTTSEPGEGTRIDVYLPPCDAPVVGEARPRAQVGGSERILFVDDEEAIAALGRELLARMGYAVTVETDSEAALRTLCAAPDAFDLLVTDQTMPRLTGLQLVRAARETKPDLRVVLTTGFSEAVTADVVAAEGINALVMKPYGGEQLGRAVRQALDDASAVAAHGAS